VSAVEKDFDRLALLDNRGWTHNNHYHRFLLQNIPSDCQHVLEIGCGTGAFSRRLAPRARRVTAVDLSSEMIRVARARSAEYPNIDFQVADAIEYLKSNSLDRCQWQFDCIVTIATLHHLPLLSTVSIIKERLKPGGVLFILDLFEAQRNPLKPEGMFDAVLSLTAMVVSGSLRLIHNGRLKPPHEVRAAWAEHGKTDSYLTMREVRAMCNELLPGAAVRKHLLWRYSVRWQKPFS
jgi:2-polyprenyl-3-methyl-5-hydroxy-6-metoxy-1,4-benzoquinol methylase